MRTEGKRRSPFLSFLSKLARPLGRKRAKGSSGAAGDGGANCDSSTVVILAPEDDSGALREQQRRRESKVHRLTASERSALHRIPEPALPEVDLDLSPCPPHTGLSGGGGPYQGHLQSSDYDVIRTLAEGCFARVLLARRRNGAPVALKAVHAELTKPRDFYRELHYSIKLGTHQGIVTTHENAAFVVRGSAVVSGGGVADARTPGTASISRHPSANSGTTSGYASCRLASLERPTPTKGNGVSQLSPRGGHSPSTPGATSSGPPLFPQTAQPLPAFYVMAQEVAPLGDLSAHVALWCKAPLWRRGTSPGVIRGRPSVASIAMAPDCGSPEASVKRAARQLASALSFMHDAGVVHRDLKLENVLVFAADLSLVKICDLGSARRSGTLVTKVRTTWSAWVPPEVRATLDREHYECRPASDAFQLGLLICTTLAAAANASAAAALAATSANNAPAPVTTGAMKAAETSTAAATGGTSWWWARRSRNKTTDAAVATKGCRRGSVPRNTAVQRASVSTVPAPLEVQPWSVAEAADPEYNSFIRWQRRRTTKIPARFRRYSARFLRLARRLLDPDPESRSPVSEVYKYLDDPWLDRTFYPTSPQPNSAASSTTQVTQSVQRPLVRPPDALRRASVDNRSARSRCGNASPRAADSQGFHGLAADHGGGVAATAGKYLTVPEVGGGTVLTSPRDAAAEEDEEEEFYEFEDECWDMEANEEDEEEDEEELDPSRRKLRRLLAACGVEGGADRYAQAQKRLWSWVLESQPGDAGTEGEGWGEEGGGGWQVAAAGGGGGGGGGR